MVGSTLLLIFFVVLGRVSLVDLCDPLAEDYDPGNNILCYESTITWYGDENGLHLKPSSVGCEQSGNETFYLQQATLIPIRPRFFHPTSTYFLEYSIEWLTNDTNCVVDLLKIAKNTNITDQNGLTNSPLEDLSDYAVNKIYKRSFLLHASAIPNFYDSDYNLEFVCASKARNSSLGIIREARITSITLVEVDRQLNLYHSFSLYNKSECTACLSAPSDEATCTNLEEYSAPQWVVNGSLMVDTTFVNSASQLFIFGDLITDRIVMPELGSILVDGCLLTNSIEGYIHLQGLTQSFRIAYNSGCALPRFTSDDSVIVTYGSNEITVQTYYDSPSSADTPPDSTQYSLQLLGVILGSVGAVGIGGGLAAAILVRNSRQRRRIAAALQALPNQQVELQSNRR